jgi:ABC-type transport system involved in cytochrome bd biosynthesis fused ATPase/permease subunit
MSLEERKAAGSDRDYDSAFLQGMSSLVTVKNLSCAGPEGDPIFVNVNFKVNEGDIIIVQARSGVG